MLSLAADASTYPDVFIRRGTRDGTRTAVDDPVVVFEVLAPETARFDLVRKLPAYRAIRSLRRVVFVAPEAMRLDIETRGGDGR